MSLAVERVLERLPDTRRTRGGFIARCPAHDDRNASLSVAQGRRGALLHCFGGCRVEEITHALGLRVAELFDVPRDAAAPIVRGDDPDVVHNLALQLAAWQPWGREYVREAYRLADVIRERLHAADAGRAAVTARGADSDETWEVLVEAAAAERDAHLIEAALDGTLP